VWPGVVAHGLNNLVTSLAARFQPGNSADIWNQGHPPWIVLAGAAVLAVCLIQLVRMTSEDS
jgi:hypothetical protein